MSKTKKYDGLRIPAFRLDGEDSELLRQFREQVGAKKDLAALRLLITKALRQEAQNERRDLPRVR